MNNAVVQTFEDATTGRTVRQLTDLPAGASLDYFRLRKHTQDGRIWAYGEHARGNVILIDPASGSVEPLPISAEDATMQLQADGRRLWLYRRAKREVWSLELPRGRAEHIVTLPRDLAGDVSDITCDGQTLILAHHVDDRVAAPIPTVKDPETFWRYADRPRHGEICTFHLPTCAARRIVTSDGVCPDHIDTSPTDPTLVRYCLDGFEAISQRIWTVRTDGSDNRMIRRQERGEMITHEFWWPGGRQIGYTYMDRRHDSTLRQVPLCEYANVPTHFGIADLDDGREVYLSAPLNSYHTHIHASPDGRFISGEGTHDNSFVFAGRFTARDARIDMQPLATIHTPYVPTRGQHVECYFSADSRWLLYNDTTPSGAFQVFAVAVEF